MKEEQLNINHLRHPGLKQLQLTKNIIKPPTLEEIRKAMKNTVSKKALSSDLML